MNQCREVSSVQCPFFDRSMWQADGGRIVKGQFNVLLIFIVCVKETAAGGIDC